MPRSARLADEPTDERPRDFENTKKTVAITAREIGYDVTETDTYIMIGRAIMTATALELPDDFTEKEAIDLAKFYRKIKNTLKCWLGDLSNTVDKRWGEKYRDIMKYTGFGYGTCRNIGSVMKRIDLSLRSDKLTFKHYIIVSAAPQEQYRYWIDVALAGDGKREVLSASKLEAIIADTLASSDPKKAVKARRVTSRERYRKFLESVEEVLVQQNSISRDYYNRMVLELTAVVQDIEKGVTRTDGGGDRRDGG